MKALLVGLPDWTNQQVDVVSVASGRTPDGGSVLTDVQNKKQGRYSGTTGDVIRIVGIGDRTLTVPVRGVGRNLMGGQYAANGDVVVLYSTPALIARLGADPGFSSLEFRLRNTSSAAADKTVAPSSATSRRTRRSGGSPTCPRCASPAVIRARTSSTRSPR